MFHQENEGVSSARNLGLKAATGGYVLFVDSDGWVRENILHLLLSEVKENNLDVGVADFQYIDENSNATENKKVSFHTDIVMTGLLYFKESFKTNITIMVWKSIYRRKFLILNELYFREGYNHKD